MATEKSSEPSVRNNALPRIALALSTLAFAMVGIRTISSSNLWFHLASGRWIASHGLTRVDPFSYTLDGARWINTSWLYDVFAYALWSIGRAPALIVVHVALATLALVLLMKVARHHQANDTALALAALLSAWLLSPRFFPTPALAAMVFPAYLLWLFAAQRRPPWLYASLIPMQVLWANCDGSYILGPLLCLGFAYESLRQPTIRPSMNLDRTVLLSVVLLVVSTINPQGLYLHKYVLNMWLTPIGNFTHEWISPYYAQFGSTHPKHLITIAYLLGACGLLLYPSRLPVVISGLAIIMAVLLIFSNRHLELFALLSFPFLAISVEACARSVSRRFAFISHRVLSFVAIGFAVATLFLMVTSIFYAHTGAISRFGLRVEHDVFPDGAAKLAASERFPQRTIHLAMDAGYLLWRNPEFHVFTDPRAHDYGSAFFHTMAFMLSGDADAGATLDDKWGPQAVIVNCTWPSSGRSIRALIDSGQWALAYFDGVSAVLLQAVSENRDLITNKENHAEGIARIRACANRYAMESSSLFPIPPPARLVGAAAVFMSLDRHREAAEIYTLLLQGAPNMVSAHMSLGVCLVQLGEAEKGLIQLKIAADHYRKDVNVWLWLARAYTETGDLQAAKQAYVRAAELDPAATVRFGNPLGNQ